MIPVTNITAIVLAAGLSRRHSGGNKLLRNLQGKPLAAYIAETLAAIPFLDRLAILGQDEDPLAEIFMKRGFTLVQNPEPERGQGHSLALGVRQAFEKNNPEAVLICLADMPFVTFNEIKKLTLALTEDVDAAVCAVNGQISPPAIFRQCHRETLVAIDGDIGARKFISTLTSTARVDVRPETLIDFDTSGDFEK